MSIGLIRKWSELRDSIKESPDEIKIQKTIEHWKNKKLIPFVLDWDRPEYWPTPWEIISDDLYDSIAISIVITDTLLLSNYSKDIELHFVSMKSDNERFMIVVTNNLAINYCEEIVEYNEIKSFVNTIQKFKKTERGYEQC